MYGTEAVQPSEDAMNFDQKRIGRAELLVCLIASVMHENELSQARMIEDFECELENESTKLVLDLLGWTSDQIHAHFVELLKDAEARLVEKGLRTETLRPSASHE